MRSYDIVQEATLHDSRDPITINEHRSVDMRARKQAFLIT
jgi:hypothetical protein